MLDLYWQEFLTVALVHLLAVASPGPDFAVVVKVSVSNGRRSAIFASLGIGCAILIHVLYSLLGIGLLVSQSVMLFNIVKYLGAAYLIYIGIQGLRQKATSTDMDLKSGEGLGAKQAFVVGFMTNGLNPKATLFFLSLFTVIISPTTPLMVQFSYGLYMMLATSIWFILLSSILSTERVRQQFLRLGHWFDRGMGTVLIALGLRLMLSSR
ncbi:LysE family translocator [Alginatibacterium sediminis]|uniref:LysE family translocator n=1 Tax=Alginatibacterium sediminis TaxID=2164068 RepID=A0A420EJN4_9ALTE|nr:LysE family transporter [Alginatibacterium sediminis]RKF20887.1 LysE family translocator [Alginatibacterium sediminis]